MITTATLLKQESLELLQQYRSSPSLGLRNRLVQLNEGLVRREVNHWLNQCGESYDDLLQVGMIGLIRAVERFDLSKGHAFSSFAVPYIRGEIQHYLRDKGTTVRIPRRWLDLQRQGAAAIRRWQIAHNTLPSDADIAKEINISLTEWQEVRLALQNRSLLSLDAPVGDGDDSQTCLGDLLPDHHYRSFQLAQEDRMRIQQALASLECRTREILEFVFLHDLTQREAAERLGISTVTVSRRLKKGLQLMQRLLSTADE
ncbi:MAG: RNA polymerase sigma factor SigF [Cyanobacteria bacterium P01_H01_bin.121]